MEKITYKNYSFYLLNKNVKLFAMFAYLFLSLYFLTYFVLS